MAKGGSKFLWLIILLTLAAVMAWALISGNILLFLAPRMVPMVWFGFGVLAVLSVFQGIELLRSLRNGQQEDKGNLGMLLFLIPILLILTASPNAAAPGALPNQTVRLANPSDTSASAPVSGDTAGDPPCVLVDELAFFNPDADHFAEYLGQTVEELDGRTLTLYGFVYKDESFAEDMVLVSRLMITCCAADASIVGFHVQVDPAIDLQRNDWIRVTGTIKTKNLLYYDAYHDFPVLTDGLILRCDPPEPENTYIVP